jgi:nitroreductase
MSDDPVHPKIARPDHEILDVIRDRWSPRAFDADRDVADADLRTLFEAARWAPSSRNEQPWRFVVARRRQSPDAFAAMLASLTRKNQAWAAVVPVLLVVAVRMTHEIDDLVNSHAWYDAGQAVAFLTLQATAQGLSTRQMQGFDPAAIRAACHMPALYEPAIVMAVGYAGDPSTLTFEHHRTDEASPRSRRALREFVFDGIWDRALD